MASFHPIRAKTRAGAAWSADSAPIGAAHDWFQAETDDLGDLADRRRRRRGPWRTDERAQIAYGPRTRTRPPRRRLKVLERHQPDAPSEPSPSSSMSWRLHRAPGREPRDDDSILHSSGAARHGRPVATRQPPPHSRRRSCAPRRGRASPGQIARGPSGDPPAGGCAPHPPRLFPVAPRTRHAPARRRHARPRPPTRPLAAR
jgi:hypothetical protein